MNSSDNYYRRFLQIKNDVSEEELVEFLFEFRDSMNRAASERGYSNCFELIYQQVGVNDIIQLIDRYIEVFEYHIEENQSIIKRLLCASEVTNESLVTFEDFYKLRINTLCNSAINLNGFIDIVNYLLQTQEYPNQLEIQRFDGQSHCNGCFHHPIIINISNSEIKNESAFFVLEKVFHETGHAITHLDRNNKYHELCRAIPGHISEGIATLFEKIYLLKIGEYFGVSGQNAIQILHYEKFIRYFELYLNCLMMRVEISIFTGSINDYITFISSFSGIPCNRISFLAYIFDYPLYLPNYLISELVSSCIYNYLSDNNLLNEKFITTLREMIIKPLIISEDWKTVIELFIGQEFNMNEEVNRIFKGFLC